MKKLFVIHADLGAAKNIIKNVLLLNNSVHWPVKPVANRLQYLIEMYQQCSWETWLDCKYKLKTYQNDGIGMALGDVSCQGLLPLNDQMTRILEAKNYAIDLFDHTLATQLNTQPYVKLLGIIPTTDLGLA